MTCPQLMGWINVDDDRTEWEVLTVKYIYIIITIGNPAKFIISGILSSLGSNRGKIISKHIPNPAVLAYKEGDTELYKITKKYPGTLQYLSDLVSRCSETLHKDLDSVFIVSSQETTLSKSAIELARDIAHIADSINRSTALEPHTMEEILRTASANLMAFSGKVSRADGMLKIAQDQVAPCKPG